MSISLDDIKNMVGTQESFITINNLKIRIDPKLEYMSLFMNKPGEINMVETKKILTTIFKDSMAKGYFPKVDDDLLEKFIIKFFNDIYLGISKVYGFISDDKFEDVKKKVQEITKS